MIQKNHIALFLIITLFLLSACSSTDDNAGKDDLIQSTTEQNQHLEGDLYFKSVNSDYDDYIHINVQNGKIKGEIYTVQDGFFGGVMIHFKGTKVSDTIINLVISDSDEEAPSSGGLIYSFDGTNLVFKGQFSWSMQTEYTLIDPGQMPDKKDYGTIEELEFEELGEYLENVFPIYYESVMPDAMRHFGGLHEYFQILEVSDTVVGFGVGSAEGEEDWEFDFTGRIEKDSIYIVRVNYRQKGYPKVSKQEKWIHNSSTGIFKLYGYNRPNNGRRYVPSNQNDFPVFIQDSLTNLNKRLTGYSPSPWELYEKRKSQLAK